MTTPLDVKTFVARGGKILIHAPWVEYHNASDVTATYKKLLASTGNADKAGNAIRLFRVRCVGGDSCDAFDKAAAIDKWLETGKAPDELLQSYTVDGKKRTLPLCAYPKVPQYKGTGDTDDAANFTCGESKLAGKL